MVKERVKVGVMDLKKKERKGEEREEKEEK